MVNQKDQLVGAILQARMGSTRLPGKVMKDILGKPMLLHIIERIRQSKTLHRMIVATTDLAGDDIIHDFCKENELSCFRGSSDDVLSRYYYAAKLFQIDVIVRLTADNPLVDPAIIDKAVDAFNGHLKSGKQIDYLCTSRYPYGMNVEVFSFSALAHAFEQATEESDREHVTCYIYHHPEMFHLHTLKNQNDVSAIRVTVDTAEDFSFVSKIYDGLYASNHFFNLEDIVQLLDQWR